MMEFTAAWQSTGATGGMTAVQATFPPSYCVLYCEASTLATTNTFQLQTAAHSSGPWVTEGSTDVAATNSVKGAAVLRLTGPFGWVRPYTKTISTGDYSYRLIGVS